MNKVIKISLFVVLVFVVKYVLSQTLVLIRPLSNIVSVDYSSSIVHKSENSKVEKFTVKNSSSINGNIYSITIYKNKMNYGVTKKPYSNNFYINSNFFGKNGKEIGEVIIDGKKINHKRPGGGYFTSNGDEFGISFYSRPKNVKYSSQTHLIGVKSGKLNKSIMSQHWSKANYYRILVGEDREGNLMVLHSDRNALVSIKMICEIAIKNGMVNGLVFDGGSSVDIGLEDNGFSHDFKTVPNTIKGLANIPKPPVYICGNFKN